MPDFDDEVSVGLDGPEPDQLDGEQARTPEPEPDRKPHRKTLAPTHPEVEVEEEQRLVPQPPEPEVDQPRIDRLEVERDYLRAEAGAERGLAFDDSVEADALRDEAVGYDDPQAVADLDRAEMLDGRAASEDRIANADYSRSDTVDREAEDLSGTSAGPASGPTAGPTAAFQEGPHPEDGSQAPAAGAARKPARTPRSRRGRTRIAGRHLSRGRER
jgi:hypothetical protein